MTFDNEMYCNNCHLTFDGENEIQFTAPNEPCCPRCYSDNFEQHRIDGKIRTK